MTVTEALERWKADVTQYEAKKYHVLAPRELGEIPPYHTPRLSVVEINPDPQAGDVYSLPGGGKLGLSRVALDRISQAAGISWDPSLSGRVDDGRDPNIVRYRAVGRLKDLSGTWRTILGEKEVDLVAVEDELRESIPRRDYIAKMAEPQRTKAIEEAVTKDMIQFRKHRLARAQSGAMNRAIRSSLALRSGYSKEELSRPFVLPKVIFTPDVSDPEVKRFLLAEATGSIAQLYGSAPVERYAIAPVDAQMLPEAPEEEEKPGQDAYPIMDADEQERARFIEAYNAADAATTMPDKAEAIQIQCEVLNAMIARKNFQGMNPKAKPMNGWSQEYRKKLFDRLSEMPDVTPF